MDSCQQAALDTQATGLHYPGGCDHVTLSKHDRPVKSPGWGTLLFRRKPSIPKTSSSTLHIVGSGVCNAHPMLPARVAAPVPEGTCRPADFILGSMQSILAVWGHRPRLQASVDLQCMALDARGHAWLWALHARLLLVYRGTGHAVLQIGFMGPAIFLSQLGRVHTPGAAVACMMASQGLDACSQSGLYSNHQVRFPSSFCRSPQSCAWQNGHSTGRFFTCMGFLLGKRRH